MDQDDELDYIPQWRGVPATVILINMFGNSKYNIFEPAHVATCRLIRQYLRLSTTHFVGVCLCGTEESSATNLDTKSLVEVMPLSLPNINDFKKLKETSVEMCTEAKELNLSNVLWHCSKMFANCKKLLSSCNLLLMTHLHDAPTAADQTPTLKRVRDLVDANVEIKIINISKDDYKIDPFYENFMLEANKGKDFVPPQPIWDHKQLERMITQESHRHLAVAKLDFEIGDGLSIGVGVYNLLKKSGQNPYKKTDLHSESNAVISNVTKTVKVTNNTDNSPNENDEQNALPVLKSEILHFQECGGERIEFTSKEMEAMKNPFGSPKIKLLGFKPSRIICKEKWFLKMGYFLFPNESSIEGSTVAFKALHKACMDMSVVVICVMCSRVNARPIVVALCPTTNPLNLDVEIGFDVVHIPFVEHIRDVARIEDDDETPIIEAAHKNVMMDILNTVKFDYQAEMFENPKLQAEIRAIEAIALEEDEDEPFIDTTKPSKEKFKDIKDDLFEELFGPFEAVNVKRPGQCETGTQSKKPRTQNIDEELLSERISSKNVNKYTVVELRQILQSKTIAHLPPLTGLRKQELVDLVYQHIK